MTTWKFSLNSRYIRDCLLTQFHQNLDLSNVHLISSSSEKFPHVANILPEEEINLTEALNYLFTSAVAVAAVYTVIN